jgi:dephospho-CoA kinase
MIVGITGCYCSGKSVASTVLQERGYYVIDVDKIGHEALDVKKNEIVRAFGENILHNGSIDRKKLGRLVFVNAGERKKLESIVHPWMIKKVRSITVEQKNTVINAALLIEMCLFVLCDFVIGIDIDQHIAIERGMTRDHLTKGEALRRLKAQIPLKEKLHYVDKVIENNESIEKFKSKVIELIGKNQPKV